MSLKKSCCIACLLLLLIFLSVSSTTAQDAMEQRITEMEKYIETIPPTLIDFSDKLQQNIQDYTTQLEASLSDYSQNLQNDVEQRLIAINNKVTVIDPTVRAFQRIDSNTGAFLIAVDKMEAINNGYKLTLNIGNPNYADYRDFSLQFLWGERWDPNSSISYDQWRDMLQGAEFSFQGAIKKGEWQKVEVDLAPASLNQVAYLECKMIVNSVELQQPNQ